jgi:peptidoglycan/xylan/chitin deacetylase (PgdA/CDA1 family)
LTETLNLRLGPRLFYPAKAALTRARSAAWAARTRGRPDTSGLRILFYHRVADDGDQLAVTRSAFREQMDMLARGGWEAVDVLELARRLETGEQSGRVVGLSFDDGYLDVGEHALPVLAERGFRATVFVATGVTDGRAFFSWYERQPPLLGWDEIRRLDGEGTLRFEAHTVTHPNLLAVGDEQARREIVESKRELEERLGRDVEGFCYPAGLFGARERRYVAEAGFRAAVSCEPGANRRGTDRLALHRIQIDARDAPFDFRAKLGGGHDSSPPLRAAWRSFRYGPGDGRRRADSSRA